MSLIFSLVSRLLVNRDYVRSNDRRETIYELLKGSGYSDWVVAEPTDPDAQTSATMYALFNFKDGKNQGSGPQ